MWGLKAQTGNILHHRVCVVRGEKNNGRETLKETEEKEKEHQRETGRKAEVKGSGT